MQKTPYCSRRTLLETLGVTATGALAFGSVGASGQATGDENSDAVAEGSDVWPSYHYGSGNTGYNPDATGPSEPLTRWETELATDVSGPILGPDAVYVVQNASTVTAVDRQTGAIRWAETVDEELAEGRNDTVLALADGRLLGSFGGSVYALDPDTGQELWTVDTGRSKSSAPTVVDGTIVLVLEGGAVLALDAKSGAEQWRVEDGIGPVSITRDVRHAPAASPGESTVVVRTATHVHALKVADGTERWRVAMETTMPPAVEDAVYLTSRHRVTSLSLADGSVRWERRFEDSDTDDDPRGFLDSTPTVVNGTVFVQQYSYPDNLIALAADSGDVQWTASTAVPTERRGTLVAGADRLYVPTAAAISGPPQLSMEFVAVDPTDGSVDWRFTRLFDLDNSDQIAHLVPGTDAVFAVVGRTLYRVDQRPAGVRWKTPITNDPDRVAVAGARTVYVAGIGGEDGSIAALETDTGEYRWHFDDPVTRRPVAGDGFVVYPSSNPVGRWDHEGELMWETEIPGDALTGFLLEDETVYFGWGDQSGGLYAIEARTGYRRWITGGPCGASMDLGPLAPTVAGDTLFVQVDGHLGGFGTTDGTERWRTDIEVDSLAAGTELAFAATGATVRALTPDGSVAWRRSLPETVTGLATVAGVLVARTSGDGASRYRALSPADGSDEWTFLSGDGSLTMPASGSDTIYAGTENGQFHAISPATGDVRETHTAFDGLQGRPAVVDGTVAVPTDDRFVYGFEELS